MGELKVFTDNTRLTNRQRAVNLHDSIVSTGSLAAGYFVEFCKKLKQMRDEGLYKELGHDSFEDYTENALNIKQRQAYSYIQVLERLGTEYVEEHALLGISKLSLLASATVEEREILDERVEVESASVAELEKALKEIADLKKQMSFLEEENIELQNAAESMAEHGEQEQSAPRISEEEINARIVKAEEQARKEALQGYAGNIKVLETAKADAEKQRKEAENKAKDLQKQKEEAEEKTKSLERELELKKQQVKIDPELQEVVAQLKEDKEKLEKQLKVSSNPVMTEFRFMLKNFQDEFNQMRAFAEKGEESEKMLTALKKVLASLADKI